MVWPFCALFHGFITESADTSSVQLKSLHLVKCVYPRGRRQRDNL